MLESTKIIQKIAALHNDSKIRIDLGTVHHISEANELGYMHTVNGDSKAISLKQTLFYLLLDFSITANFRNEVDKDELEKEIYGDVEAAGFKKYERAD